MARQCPCGHDSTKPGEGADDTLARHHTHQYQISPRGRPRSSRQSSRLPWPRPEAQEAMETRAQGGNRLDLTDRQVRHRGIYRSRPILVANFGGSGQNRARRQQRRRSRQSSGEGRKRGGRVEWPVGLTEPPGRVQPGRPAPTGGPRPDRWGQADRWGWGGFFN
jgi:hypothetical protein